MIDSRDYPCSCEIKFEIMGFATVIFKNIFTANTLGTFISEYEYEIEYEYDFSNYCLCYQ